MYIETCSPTYVRFRDVALGMIHLPRGVNGRITNSENIEARPNGPVISVKLGISTT